MRETPLTDKVMPVFGSLEVLDPSHRMRLESQAREIRENLNRFTEALESNNGVLLPKDRESLQIWKDIKAYTKKHPKATQARWRPHEYAHGEDGRKARVSVTRDSAKQGPEVIQEDTDAGQNAQGSRTHATANSSVMNQQQANVSLSSLESDGPSSTQYTQSLSARDLNMAPVELSGLENALRTTDDAALLDIEVSILILRTTDEMISQLSIEVQELDDINETSLHKFLAQVTDRKTRLDELSLRNAACLVHIDRQGVVLPEFPQAKIDEMRAALNNIHDQIAAARSSMKACLARLRPVHRNLADSVYAPRGRDMTSRLRTASQMRSESQNSSGSQERRVNRHIASSSAERSSSNEQGAHDGTVRPGEYESVPLRRQ